MSTGRVVNARYEAAGGNTVITQGLDGPMLGPSESDTWQVTLQTVGGVIPAGTALKYIISYWVGDATFTLPMVPLQASTQRALVGARKVTVDIWTLPGGSGGFVPVSIGLSRGGTMLGPEGGGQWLTSGAALSNVYDWGVIGGVAVRATKIYAAQANVVNFGGQSTLYLMFIDKASGAPTGGENPIPGGTSAAMTAAAPSFDFSADFRPLHVQQHLYTVISSTPGSYTAVPGATFCIDFWEGLQ
jgi:hypothetical protein